MMHPLDPDWVYYGVTERELWRLDKFQPKLFPDKVCQLRLKLYHYDETCRKAGCGKTARPV